jgi:hypothetical protein
MRDSKPPRQAGGRKFRRPIIAIIGFVETDSDSIVFHRITFSFGEQR